MVFAITITQTTGKIIEQVQFSNYEEAQAFYKRVLETTSYKRVLVLLLEKPTSLEENILEVEYIEGITYVHPNTSYSSVNAPGKPQSIHNQEGNLANRGNAEPDSSPSQSQPWTS